ncbi:biotin-independent malonate decarboxylase subunit gamma [Duganella sp. FT3S]|uniref:Biotin-independent malonate decarboxylase subunit gamma n=1 Tax=Rugamonas fusca TaxID=2758568 RepID=A0A7W2EEJ2_9BURK|nr:biotin-independent malonate decarboxylase subunit gamma [Rugamonas fusca]MBA5604478.1 biotin-independent malonate decarboxylase subunit gamma [Rugamonas fusca]
MTTWTTLAAALFPQGHTITEQDDFLNGVAQVDGQTVAVIGTTRHAAIGVEIALAQAQAVLRTVRDAPGRPIVLLVDTQGQRLRHRDEMLGIQRYMAHLGKCLELARQRGHRIVALVYDQALSGGFVSTGLMADGCYALPDATIRVMGLAAMARITKVPEAELAQLARSHPVFAPGPENYTRMGALQAIWHGDLAAALANALAQVRPTDERAALGLARGGRQNAYPVMAAVMGDVAAAS